MTDLDISEARAIAADWHSGQWSALYSFSSTGTIQSGLESEVETIIRECEHRVADRDYATRLGSDDPHELLRQARELHEFITQPIVSVWSSHGHTFLHEGGYGSCLTCGGDWELVRDDPEDPTHGAYQASNGDDATHCKGVGTEHGESRAEDDPGDCNCCLCAG